MSWTLVGISIPVLLLVELVYFRIADKFNIIDRPNERSSHKSITLRGGGIVFYFSALYYFVFSGLELYWFMAGLTIITAVSFADDISSLSSGKRMVLQFASMLLMFVQLDIFNGEYPIWFALVALIVCAGVINAYNFMDGINGITGAYSLSAFLSLLYIDCFHTRFIAPEFICIVIAGILVFSFFNFRKKAKCFAGDVGSVSIAFILLFMLGKLIAATGNFSYIIILLLYGVDTILTIIHRIMLKENIFEAHRKHAYQIMANELKMPHVTVSTLYFTIQTLFMAGYFLLFDYCYWYLAASIALLCTLYVIFMKAYFGLHINAIKQTKQNMKQP